jgi:enoyl-[acyl-carrier protein] reductase I
MAGRQGIMAGKRGLILGVANNRSIAYGIAKACVDHGAEIALTYQGEACKKRVEPLAAELGAQTLALVSPIRQPDAVFDDIAGTGASRFRPCHRLLPKDELTVAMSRRRDNFPHHGHFRFPSPPSPSAQKADERWQLAADATYYGAEK